MDGGRVIGWLEFNSDNLDSDFERKYILQIYLDWKKIITDILILMGKLVKQFTIFDLVKHAN